MSYEGGLNSVVAEIRQASENITAGDAPMNQRLDGIERSVNELFLKQGRPGASWESKDDEVAERKEAIGLCQNRRALTVPKIDAGWQDGSVYPMNSRTCALLFTMSDAGRTSAVFPHCRSGRLAFRLRARRSSFAPGCQM